MIWNRQDLSFLYGGLSFLAADPRRSIMQRFVVANEKKRRIVPSRAIADPSSYRDNIKPEPRYATSSASVNVG